MDCTVLSCASDQESEYSTDNGGYALSTFNLLSHY